MFSNLVRGVLNSRAILPKCLKTCSPSLLRFSNKTHVAVKQEVLPSDSDIRLTTTNTIQKVNDLIARGAEGRLFAVVHVAGKQFKITAEDIIIIEGYWPPTNGDQINLEKVMLVGGTDFTLIGRPILPHGLVTVRATVIEKDLSHTKPIFYKKRRKQYQRINFYRSHYTMLRINEIIVSGDVNNTSNTVQVERTLASP
uniref:Large ribosomal subunit protein bL21m n=1 Tax=Lygus hesperus TaxID=30085 RepID=A0A0A9Y5S9_LYGHE